MRQMILEGAGRARWHEADEPKLADDNAAIVEPLAVATCDVDVVMLRGKTDFLGKDFVIGHEATVRVVDVGDAVTNIQPGDVAVVPFQISCGECRFCRRGLTGHCESIPGNPMFGLGPFGGNVGGMLAERFAVPYAHHMLVPVPAGVDPLGVAAASDNLSDAYRCVSLGLEMRPNADVLVVGGRAASIGFYAIQIAQALGAKVFYADRSPDRIDRATQFDVDIVEWAGEGGSTKCDLTIDASGSPTGLIFALRSTDHDGVCFNAGMLFGDARLPLFDMYANGVTLVTSRNSSRTYIPPVLDLVKQEPFDPARVIDAVVEWDEAEEALSDPPDKLVIKGPHASQAPRE